MRTSEEFVGALFSTSRSRIRAAGCLVLLVVLARQGHGAEPTGHPNFASPHAAPIARSPSLGEVYVANTPADTLDVIDTAQRRVAARVPTGIDPVSVAVRPDGKEVWVSNHLSDTVSVIDVDPASPTRYQVIATVTAWNDDGWVTDFDEPSGIAFASDAKAYVALSSRNRIAVVDVASRTVTKQIQVYAQEPRAIAVRGGRLFVIAFESGNRSELSGCFDLSEPGCTFHIGDLASNSNDAILTRNMVADIVRRPDAPDRDLFVYDTAHETPLFEVSHVGTLLYGLAIDSAGRVFIAQTEARNDANGGAGTRGDGLPELLNRMFLNQIARVDCSTDCIDVTLIDLEPVPPDDPFPGAQLATPFGIQVSADDTTVVAVAAASSRLFTVDAATGEVLGITAVGAIPRGLVLEPGAGGAPERAWVLNAVENSVSVVDVSDPRDPRETDRIPLDDPTHPAVKEGRIAFNDAAGSTTGTFACASCHPDGNTDQLLWNLGSRCITAGCDQAQPRTTMPIRGLRDTLPLHWDGVPGDPFGGINAELADSGQTAAPNCSDEHGCFRNLVDGAMSGTMCDQTDCPLDENELGRAGAFGEAERDAMAVFLRSVPYPPARSRRLDDRFSALGAEGFRNFLIGVDPQHPGCSRAGVCHSLPFWAGTNTPGTGFDAPTFRGMTDRHLLLPNGRAGMWRLHQLRFLNEVAWDPNHGPDELYSWGMTFGTESIPLTNRDSAGTGPFPLFQLFEEGSTGFSAAFGRQVTLDRETTSRGRVDATRAVLRRLEEADTDGVVSLRAEGVHLDSGTSLALSYGAGSYESADGALAPMTGDDLVDAAQRRELVVTVTARIGPSSDVDHPQPALWLPRDPNSPGQNKLQRIPELTDNPVVVLFGRHVVEGAIVLIDGRAVGGEVSCRTGGSLPDCEDERLRIRLPDFPAIGDHTLQIATPGGLLSNEVLIISHTCPDAATFESTGCRLGTLLETVAAATDLGPLHEKLHRLVVQAVEALDQAETSSAAERDTSAQRLLRRVMHRLRSFVRRVDSLQGRRSIPEATRTLLTGEANAILEDVIALRETL
jgi:YVTN family beta-propeller protein